MEYFSSAKRGTLLDLGAGQGRDSIPLSKMNYDVTAVDISSVGIEQIKKLEPSVNAVVSDLYSFDVSGYDYILLDSIVHFYKRDMEKETKLIQHILNHMDTGTTLINCLLKNKRAETILKEIIKEFNTQVIQENYIDYPDFGAEYHMYIIAKESD